MLRRFLLVLFILCVGLGLWSLLSKKPMESSSGEKGPGSEQGREENVKASSSSDPSTSQADISSREPMSGMRERKLNSPSSSHQRPVASQNKNFIDTSSIEVESAEIFAGTPWKIWKGARAMLRAQAQQRGLPVVAEVSGYSISLEPNNEVNVREFSPDQGLVVVNSRTQVAGVVTGTFGVVLREGFTVEKVFPAEGVKILDSFPEIRTYYVTSAITPFDLQTFQSVLQSQPGVEKVHMEILSRNYEKK
ncbi:MAG: hypothetical protein AAGB31_06550 [Bdellovibrio sp.]